MEVALVVLDGWGLAPGDDPDHRNAVAAADTPHVDGLLDRGASGRLTTAGRAVGLPDGQMGNSEVGHLTIGAGRVVKQAFTRIEDVIDAGELGNVEAIDGAFAHAERTGGRVHLLGLLSDGGVHSHQRHLHALVRAAADRGVPAVTHAFTDGRDTDPTAGADYLRDLERVVADAGTGDVATVTGRYHAMDRDGNWERTKRAYDAVVNRAADHRAPSAVAAAEAGYDRGETDEFLDPTLVEGGPPLADGDAALFANFRADRARQLTRMLADIDPGDWHEAGVETDPPDVHLATMTEYDRAFDLPVAFPPQEAERTLGAAMAAAGRTQARVAESEKYPHVTYFLNGGREVEFDGELRHIVDSPDVPTYDEAPAMSAAGVTDAALELLAEEDPGALVLNYANPDMVGHTGDFEAAVAACEAVDREVGRLVPELRAAGAAVLVTADHGNAEDMGTAAEPHTAHTTNDVPAALVTPGEGAVGRDEWPADADLPAAPTPPGGDLRDGELADVAPTLLELAGVDVPAAMTGRSLLD
jgi:2,3-bisphosphoglycerate-independent phosphoglycerate mutase